MPSRSSIAAADSMLVSPTTSLQRGQAKDPLRSALALCVKEAIWRYAIRFQPSKRPIGLYASRRSGSSLLMEVICVNPGVMYSDQPFGLYTASSATINRLPIFPYGQVAYPDPAEEAVLYEFVAGLLNGRYRPNLPWKIWSQEFHFRNDRICLKITDAKTMIAWMASHFDIHTVVLTRHPIAQAVSVAKLGWLPTGKGLLRNAAYVRRWLSDDLEAYCWQVYREGSDLQQRVTDWALENLPLLAQLPDHADWLFVSYEDLIAHTPAAVEFLADQLGLPYRDKMMRRVEAPSRSTKRESSADRKQLIRQQDRERLLDSWQSQLTPAELQDCFHILDRFHIDLYRPDASLPDHRRVGREGFA